METMLESSGCVSYPEYQAVLSAGNPVSPQTCPQPFAKGREAEMRAAHRRAETFSSLSLPMKQQAALTGPQTHSFHSTPQFKGAISKISPPGFIVLHSLETKTKCVVSHTCLHLWKQLVCDIITRVKMKLHLHIYTKQWFSLPLIWPNNYNDFCLLLLSVLL